MFNLFDILQNQSGPGMRAVGQQFGLSPDQSRAAMEALLPALTAGLRRSAVTDPTGFGRLLGLADIGGFAKPTAAAQPDAVFGQLFGSPALAQAVLNQAAAASGIGAQTLRQVLPVMAGMVVAGIVHMLLNQSPPQVPAQAAPQPIGRADEPATGQVFPIAALWNDWIDGFLASPPTRPDETTPARPETRRPLEPVRREIPAAADPAPPDGRPTGGANASGGDQLETLQQLFQTGIEVQEQNARAMNDIFTAFFGAPVRGGEGIEDADAEGRGAARAPGGEPPAPRRKARTKTSADGGGA